MMTPERISTPTMGAREWSMLIALSVLWGGSFFFFKVLGRELPPFTVVLGRVGLAAIALNVLLALRHDPMPTDGRLWRSFLAMGLLNNVIPFTLIAFGETRIASGLAAILNATTPLFTILVAHVFTKDEKITAPKAAGVVLGLVGVAVLIGPATMAGVGKQDIVGEVACLLAALTYAIAGLFGRRFRYLPPLKVATGQITASSAVLLPLAFGIDRVWNLPAPSAAAWLSFAGIALLSTALAYILYFRILAAAGATNLLLVTFLLPVSATALGVAFLDETLGARAIAGMALIGAGLVAIDGRAYRAIRG